MATSMKIENQPSLANLFELQDNERLEGISLHTPGGTMYKGKESNTLSLLNKFRVEGESGFCDVILEVEGRQLTTHRCVLAANSQFFYTMFGSGMKESSQKLLRLHSVSFTAMSLILEYFYTREILIDEDNVLDLLHASSFLLVIPVKNACIELLSKQLASDNCFSVLQIAEQFGADLLARKAKNFIKVNFSIVVKNEEFASILQKDLVSFLSSDEIQVEKEEEVYQCVLKWVKHDEANRSPVLPELLKHLRMASLPKGFLQSSKEPLVKENTSLCVPAPKKVKKRKWTRKSKKSKDIKSLAEKQVRPSTEMHDVLVGVGTEDCRRAFCYDFKKKELFSLPDLSFFQYSPHLAVIGRTLYLVGGLKYGTEAAKRVSALNFDDTKKLCSIPGVRVQLDWKVKSSHEAPKVKGSLVAFNDLLYYIGGWQVSDCSGMVECYNPQLDEWSICAGLDTPRCKSGCVTTESHIYIIGGGTRYLERRDTTLSSVERYDPDKDSWSYVACLREARSMPGCVYWSGKIYAIGGIDPSGVQTTSCEVYTPSINQWQPIAKLPYPHCPVNNVIIVKNQVTVPLRLETTSFSCDAVKYNARSNKWQKVKSLTLSDKIGSYTLQTMKLPQLILQRLCKEHWPTDFFADWKDSDDDDAYFDSDSETSSFYWNSPSDVDDYHVESEGEFDYLFF
ncbi:kelch-like protein 12 [Stylophora pistillata]|uniref:kelch-like protein 12 n=1 Tax=Stylophora pistillata TaxID=50429 RepID=UPI000C04D745|nr:kelch-like protein 12 [Stylophora pistillata]